MYKEILVPLDGTSFSEIALPHAGNLVSAFGAHCHILWVDPLFKVPSDVLYAAAVPFQPPFVVANDTQDEDIISQQLDEMIANAPGENYSYSIETGELAEKTLAYAQQASCDLIVMANRQQSGLAKYLAGSNAQDVSEQAPCPVLLVTDTRHDETIHQKVCERVHPHHEKLAQAARCTVNAAEQAIPEAVAMLLKGLATIRDHGAKLSGILEELRFHHGGVRSVSDFLSNGHSGPPLGLVSHIMHENATKTAELLARDIPTLTQTQALSLLAFLSPIVLTELVACSEQSSALREMLQEEVISAESQIEERGYSLAGRLLS